MFGFRNRKQYNGSVDEKLSNGDGIATRDNPKFPGALGARTGGTAARCS